tara:strand:+ start:1052 stop:2866 length:1815 start_codon:yes stop_codon:yes gene_type:complete
MADTSLFGRLRTLFSTGNIVRRVGDNQLKVVDINSVQHSNLATNRLVDRFNRLYQSSRNTGYNYQQNYHTHRLQLFTDYEMMDEDSIISSALDIYADESTMKNEYGDILTVKSGNDDTQKILHNLFYDILNIEFNLWPWVRNLVKYGDFYLKLDITEKYGITNVIPITPYEMIREEGMDPANPSVVIFHHDPAMGGAGNYAASQANTTKYENYEIAHFRMLSDANFLPYGKSMVEPARKNWKQLTLMEDAMMIHRIMRAPEKRIFKVDIGNIPPNEVDNYMQRIMNQMKKTPYIDQETGNYNLKFNLNNMMEDFYLPVRGGQSGTEIDTLSGMEFGGIEDIEYLRNRMFAALKIPKAFLGYDENTDGKATLAAEDVRFARTIERIQKIVISELTKIAIVHLHSQGMDGEDLVNFSLELTNPSKIYEQEQIELWSSKVSLADSIQSGKMLGEKWIYENIFNMSSEEVEKQREQVIEDRKRYFRHNEIESGNDPVQSGEAKSTEWALAGVDAESPADAPQVSGFFEENEPGQGRPKEGPKAGTDKSARGRDPIGKKKMKSDHKNRDRSIKHNFRENNRRLVKMLFNKDEKSDPSLLNENNLLDDNL